jgi:hypothetical protein
MEFNKSKEVLIKAFKEFEVDTWERLGFSRLSNQIKTFEVPLTKNLLYKCYQLAKGMALPIEIYEAKNEKVNGNDIEFAIETSDGYVKFPMQAKVVKPNSKYTSFGANSKCLIQLKLLNDYAVRNNGIPMYLLYNTLHEIELTRRGKVLPISNPKYYGSSVLKSYDLTNLIFNDLVKVPTFWDIYPDFGVPVHYLILSYQHC